MGGGGGSGFQPAVGIRPIARWISEVGNRRVSRGGAEIAEGLEDTEKWGD